MKHPHSHAVCEYSQPGEDSCRHKKEAVYWFFHPTNNYNQFACNICGQKLRDAGWREEKVNDGLPEE